LVIRSGVDRFAIAVRSAPNLIVAPRDNARFARDPGATATPTHASARNQGRSRPLDADVAVVGVGGFGSAALWRGALRGLRMLGFEQHEPGHALGSSHGESRVIRTAYFEDERYVPLVREAFGLWRELEAATGTRLLTMTGALMLGPPDSGVVAGTLASVRRHGLDHELLDTAALRTRFPQHRVPDGTVAVHERAAGVLRPEDAVRAAAAAATASGARLVSGVRVERVSDEGDCVVVSTAERDYRVGRAVVTAGPWIGRLVPSLARVLQVERQVQVWFAPGDVAAYSAGRFPVFIREVTASHHVYGLPAMDGRTVKLAVHHEGEPADPDDVDRTVRPADVAPLSAYAGSALAGVHPEPVRGAVCLYTNSPDEHFVVGSAPGNERVVVAGGCSGHGFKFSPVLGDIAIDLVSGGGTSRAIGLFDPARLG
jgi:sarcosine oxidase